MAAAIQVPRLVIHNDSEIVVAVRLSVMTSDQIENLNYFLSTAPYATPRHAWLEVVTPSLAHSVLQLACDCNAAVLLPRATTRYVPGRVYTEAGGDITGAIVDVMLSFDAVNQNS